MIPRVNFRLWSHLVEMGENGRALLSAHRYMRRSARELETQITRDAILHGRGITRISMGEGCTPIIQRIDPMDFYVHPQDRGDT